MRAILSNVLTVESLIVYQIRLTVRTAVNFSTTFVPETMIAKHMDLTKGMRTVFVHPVVPKHFFTKKDT